MTTTTLLANAARMFNQGLIDEATFDDMVLEIMYDFPDDRS